MRLRRTGISVVLSMLMLICLSSVAGEKIVDKPLKDSRVKWQQISNATNALPMSGTSERQTASLILDVDKDQRNDFIIGAADHGPSVVWYRRGVVGWTRYVIDSSHLDIEAGGTVLDVDGDGDLDIIFGSLYDTKIWWWENPYPHYDPNIPWTRREIKNSGAQKHHDQLVGDFNGDGLPELVFWNQHAKKLFMASIPKNVKQATSWPYVEIFSWDEGEYEGLASVDINGDGKLDIVGGGRWFEHIEGNRFIPHVIDDAQRFSRVAVGQLKKGGRPEVVFAAGDVVGRLKWYEWDGEAWIGHDLLDRDILHGHSLEVADIDGDGNLDIFSAEMRQWTRGKDDHPDAKSWIFYGDGKGNFRKTEITSGYGNHESKIADLDGDGDLDILMKSFMSGGPSIDVWLNNGTRGGHGKSKSNKWKRHVIDPDRPWRAIFIAAGDMDNDGNKDIITGAWWYRNPGRADGRWERRLVGAPLNNMAAVYDFDGDGFLDVLGTQGVGSTPNANFVWARNDGSGNFVIHDNIDYAKGDFLQGVAVAPFSNLGPIEVALSWHWADHGVQMFTVPPDPVRDRWTWRRLSRTSQDEQLSIGDIDRDGTLDLLLGTRWLCNGCPQYHHRIRGIADSLGVAWLRWKTQTIFSAPQDPDRNRLVDINGDGRLDAVVGYEAISVPGKLAWYEQPSDPTQPWKEHLIATLIGPMSLDAVDMDGDGDIDIVVGEHNLKTPASARMMIFENVDGKGLLWKAHAVHTGDEHHDGAIAVDIDGDGDLDILSIGWSHNRVLLYENMAIDGRKARHKTVSGRSRAQK